MSRTENYQQFTKPAELQKAINMLSGIVSGIEADTKINDKEITELVNWCQLHENLRNRHPFSELLPVVDAACEDGVVTSDELEDILWICHNMNDDSSYYDDITASIQQLSGLIHGVMADGALSDAEIMTIKAWIDNHDFLAGTYPFDEIDSLLSAVLADKVITAEEREQLMAFFSNVIEFKDSYNLVEQNFADLRNKYSICGICAMCPEIQIKDHLFCFTGESYKASRDEINNRIAQLGGIARGNVSKKTDYLIVGEAGNPCWAYACYGRKIEAATSLRKEGAHVVIVNEHDFWDAVEDLEAGIE